MEPVSIDVDGSIELIDREQIADTDSSAADRSRRSRLNDVMIVLEREHAGLEQLLRERVTRTVMPHGLEKLAVSFDENAPRFHVAIQPTFVVGEDEELSPARRAALETEIAAEVLSTIQQRTAKSENPRWQPTVTATYRTVTPAEATRKGRLRPEWPQTLFWLLAVVILGAIYFYFKHTRI